MYFLMVEEVYQRVERADATWFIQCITEPPIQLICSKKPFHLETKQVTIFAYEL